VTSGELPRVEQEREAVATRVIVRVAVVAVVVIVLAIIVSDRLLLRDTLKLRGSPPPLTTVMAPRVIGIVDQTLTSRPGGGIVQKEDEKLALRRYAWVDRAHGLVRIPIDRAISLYVENQSLSDAGAIP
jgi:hypothetical protein